MFLEIFHFLDLIKMTKIGPVHAIKILFDVLVFSLTGVIWTMVDMYIPRNKTGFSCDDYSITLPYKESTVKTNTQMLISTLVPILIICGTEIVKRFYASYKFKNKIFYKINFFGNKLIDMPDIIGSLYINLGSYFFGFLLTSLIINIAKYTVGRLRPHFLNVCQPMFMNENKTGLTLVKYDCSYKTYYQYNVDFICTSKNLNRLNDASLSFPSAISAYIFYTSVFLMLYIHYSWVFRKFGLLKTFSQLFFIVISIYISLTRVADYKHFYSDVAAGAILGTLLGLFIFYSLTDFMRENLHQIPVASNDYKVNENNEHVNP